MEEDQLLITAEESGDRIDALLARNIEGLSRSQAQRLLESGLVRMDGAAVRKNYRCIAGDRFDVTLPAAEELPLLAQDLPLDVVFEDSDVIVVNKPRGMVVHPAPGHPDGTLVNALLFHCGDSLSGIGGVQRPGIVHRIDKDTSGLLVVAKNDFAHQGLSAQLSDHSLCREYEAVVNGAFRETNGTVDRPIGRHPVDRKRMAVTEKNTPCSATDSTGPDARTRAWRASACTQGACASSIPARASRCSLKPRSRTISGRCWQGSGRGYEEKRARCKMML